VLYAASQRAACFAETLAAFRLSLASLAAERAVLNTEELQRVPQVPAAWWHNRMIGTFSLSPGRWLDLRTLDTFQLLREVFAEIASGLGLADVDLSAVTGVLPIAGDERRFTQAISRWAYDHDYHGIAYTSRLHHRFTGWAVFDSASILPIGEPVALTPADRDFVRMARSFGLSIEQDPSTTS
jgi:hypothetical protein